MDRVAALLVHRSGGHERVPSQFWFRNPRTHPATRTPDSLGHRTRERTELASTTLEAARVAPTALGAARPAHYFGRVHLGVQRRVERRWMAQVGRAGPPQRRMGWRSKQGATRAFVGWRPLAFPSHGTPVASTLLRLPSASSEKAHH